MDIFTFDRMRKRGIRVIGEEFANKVVRIFEPRGLFVLPYGDALDLPSSTIHTFYDESKLKAFIKARKGRCLYDRGYVAIDNSEGFAWTEEFPTLSEAVDWLSGEFEVGW